MADRYPLILNNTSNTIQELPSGDNLNLSGCDIVNAGTIASTGFTGPLTGNVTGNVTGSAGSAATATTAGTVTTAAQPNITSTGTLTGLTSNGVVDFTNASNVSLGPIGNVRITGGSANQILRTDGTGTLSFATVSAASYMLLPVRACSITNTTLSGGATVDGIVMNNGDRVLIRRQNTATENGIYIVNTSGAWTRASDFTTGAETLVSGVTVTVQEGTQMKGVTLYCSNAGTIVIGTTAIAFERVVGGSGYVSIWSATNHDIRANANSSSGGTAIGVASSASTDGTAMGYFANTTAAGSVAYGYVATAQASQSVAIGVASGTLSGTAGGVAIGRDARSHANGVSVGFQAGLATSGQFTINIGHLTGQSTQGSNAIAIGASAGRTGQANNSIIINATGANLNQTTANSLTIKPIRAATAANVLYYDNSTGEVTQSAFAFPTYTIAGKPGSGSVGQVISISNSVPAGLLAYWDGTNNRWSYVYDNSAV